MTLGCKVNQFETDAMSGLFREAGYAVVPFTETADVYVINTCSVTSLSDRKSRQMIRRAHKQNPAALIVAAGCWAQLNAEEASSFPGVMVVAGNQGKKNIVSLVERALTEKKIMRECDAPSAAIFDDIAVNEHPGRTRAFLKIEDGCQNFCSYCIIPYARGKVRSRPLAEIGRAAQKIAAAGFGEIVLTGIHLGLYGQDLPGKPSLAAACREILSVGQIMRLRLGSLESVEADDELLSLMASEPRLMPHLHLPLQSGCDAVLKNMNRHYTTADFTELIAKIRHKVPNVAISTDVIVGFPGETEDFFALSLKFVQSQKFARIHIFPYSKRQGTPAAKMDNQVLPQVKKERVRIMQHVAEQASQEFRLIMVGRTVTVLWETCLNGVTDGLTENYVRVYVHGEFPAGTLGQVKLTGIYADGMTGMPV